jgi:hypothetical protein
MRGKGEWQEGLLCKCRWCKYYIAPKVEAAKADENMTENDESIVYFLQLLAILCGQHSSPLSLQEKGIFILMNVLT